MTEAERKDVQKALAYDLICVLEQQPGKTYTAEEIKHIIRAYIAGTES